jgi:epidermal growth factor receptor substrate 15
LGRVEGLITQYGPEIAAFIAVLVFAFRSEVANRKTRTQNDSILTTAQAALTTAQANQQEAETSTRIMVDGMTQQMYSEMRQRDHQYNELLKQFTDLKVENALLSGKWEGSEKTNQSLIDHLKQSLAGSQEEVKELRAANQLLEKQIAALNAEKTELKTRLDVVELEIKALREREAQTDAKNSTLKSQNEELEREKVQLLERIAELEKRVLTLETEKSTMQTRIDHLEEEVKKREQSPQPAAAAVSETTS